MPKDKGNSSNTNTSVGTPGKPSGTVREETMPTIPGPVPSTPRRDGPKSGPKISLGTTADDNFMVVNKPKK
jgi:hypothetical protein